MNDIKNNNSSNKSILFIALQRHKKGLLIVLLIAMMSSSFAWFYSNLKVALRVDGEVESWNVSITESGTQTFSFENIHPGIEITDDSKYSGIKNTGRSPARMSIEIDSLYLFGKKLEKGTDYTVKSFPVYEEDSTTLKSMSYKINGLPFEIEITMPEAIIPGCTTDEVDEHGKRICPEGKVYSHLKWNFDGDLTPVDIPGEDETQTISVPTCLNNIKNQDVLNYVNEEKLRYEEIGITIDDTPGTPVASNRFTTCDIIDTYYGEKADEFKKYVDTVPDEEKDKDKIFHITQDEAGNEVRIPLKSLYINVSLTISQAGGPVEGK